MTPIKTSTHGEQRKMTAARHASGRCIGDIGRSCATSPVGLASRLTTLVPSPRLPGPFFTLSTTAMGLFTSSPALRDSYGSNYDPVAPPWAGRLSCSGLWLVITRLYRAGSLICRCWRARAHTFVAGFLG